MPETLPRTVVRARRPRRPLFLLPARILPVIGASTGTGDHFRAPALRVALAILSMFGCEGAAANYANARPRVADPACSQFATFVAEATQRFGIPAALICAVIHAESSGNARATSARGAIGLMQIMPGTWTDLHRRYHLGTNPYDARENIIAGAAYLRELNDRYGNPGFVAAYNAGPARWEDHLATGRLLPMETRTYLRRLAPVIGERLDDETTLRTAVASSWTAAPLFPALSPRLNIDNAITSVAPAAPPSNDTATLNGTALALQPAGLFVAAHGSDPTQ